MSIFKSKFESDVAKSFRQAGIKFEYEPVVLSFTQPSKKRKYKPDFKIRTKTGIICLVETKGRLTIEDRKKLIWVKEQHPKTPIILLFMNSSVTLRKGSKTTYAEWARDNGFEFYDFRFGLPKGWLKKDGT